MKSSALILIFFFFSCRTSDSRMEDSQVLNQQSTLEPDYFEFQTIQDRFDMKQQLSELLQDNNFALHSNSKLDIGFITKWNTIPKRPISIIGVSGESVKYESLQFEAGKTFWKVVDTKVSAGVTMGMSIAAKLLLIKETPNFENITKIENGKHVFVKDGNKLVTLCTLSLEPQTNARIEASVKVKGNGISQLVEFVKTRSLTKYSAFYEPKDDITVPEVIDFCLKSYKARELSKLQDELSEILKYYDYQPPSASDKLRALKAVFNGPEDQFFIGKQLWYFGKAKTSKSAGFLHIEGEIRVTGMPLMLEARYPYRCSERFDKHIRKVSDLEPGLKEWVDTICREAFLELGGGL